VSYYVYILANHKHGTLYVGITRNLIRRIHEHREAHLDGFTRRYDTRKLVYFEAHDTVMEAIRREKRLKHWLREWKIELIEEFNPSWTDLWSNILY
jgi:putative endonuclease